MNCLPDQWTFLWHFLFWIHEHTYHRASSHTDPPSQRAGLPSWGCHDSPLKPEYEGSVCLSVCITWGRQRWRASGLQSASQPSDSGSNLKSVTAPSLSYVFLSCPFGHFKLQSTCLVSLFVKCFASLCRHLECLCGWIMSLFGGFVSPCDHFPSLFDN